MAKLPALQFYVGDWRKDPGVQSLSFHDRGVWFEMICLMHESEQRGHLVLNGKPMTEEQLSRVLGLDKQSLTKTIHALYEAGVCSKCLTSKSLYCRRMVRDEELRLKRKSAGSLGGNPAICGEYNEPGFIYLARRESDKWVKIGASRQPEKRLYAIRKKFSKTLVHLIGKFATEDMGRTERELHAKMAERVGEDGCRDGEWFLLTDEDIQFCRETLGESSESHISPIKKLVDLPVNEKIKRNLEDEDEDKDGSNQENGFETFWRAYPEKSGKKIARIAYQKAIARLEKSLLIEDAQEKLLSAALEYSRFLKNHPSPPKAKYAQGWLNDERYEDDFALLPSVANHDPRGNLALREQLERERAQNGV